jgi:PBSX family phage terminase large subunit
MKSSINNEITPEKALRELWMRGKLTWKLHPVQKKMLDSYNNSKSKTTVITCARRLGKSYLLCILASEKCIQQPNIIVKYLCPVKKQVKTVIKPIMEDIFKDCPAEMRPEFKQNDYMYVFPNGSQIQMAGTDGGHAESLRGGKSDLWIIDESGFCTELSYVIRSILAPTTLTTGGRGILASTPSKSPDHEFITDFVKPAEFKKELIKYTIYDNPLINEQTLQEVIADFPLGEQDPEFRREYLCEIIRNEESAVIPEFTTAIEKEIVKEVKRPAFYDSYVSMDIGFRDQTAVLFGYWDFKNAALVIEDEFIQDGETLLMDKFAIAVKQKEEKLWTNAMSGEFKPPYIRVSDNNNQIMLNQLTYDHNLLFIPTRKDQKEAAIATLRLKVANKQIIIHPRCETLLYHLRNATWDKKGKQFTRSPDGSHYDCLDALIYMLRNVVENKNPYPAGYGMTNGEFFMPEKQKSYTKNEQAWLEIFKPKSSLKFKRN